VVGLTIKPSGWTCQIGEVCEIHSRSSAGPLAEGSASASSVALLMPLGEMQGPAGQPDLPTNSVFRAPVGMGLLGRVLNGLGERSTG
jgi:flagellar biosynthesis/type III secretory pathway ATPase